MASHCLQWEAFVYIGRDTHTSGMQVSSAFLRESAILQRENSVAVGKNTRIVRGKNQPVALTRIVRPVTQQGDNLMRIFMVESCSWLIGENNRGVVHQAAGNSNTLLLASRKLTHAYILFPSEVHFGESLRTQCLRLVPIDWFLAILKRNSDVLPHFIVVDDSVILANIAEHLVSQPCSA